MINFLNTSVFSEERDCLNYPYPEGIYLKIKSKNRKQLIYTKSVSIKSQNIRKIEFIKILFRCLKKLIKSESFDKQFITLKREYAKENFCEGLKSSKVVLMKLILLKLFLLLALSIIFFEESIPKIE